MSANPVKLELPKLWRGIPERIEKLVGSGARLSVRRPRRHGAVEEKR